MQWDFELDCVENKEPVSKWRLFYENTDFPCITIQTFVVHFTIFIYFPLMTRQIHYCSKVWGQQDCICLFLKEVSYAH